MTHLLHEVKAELDWATREVLDVEHQYTALEELHKTQQSKPESPERTALMADIEAQKKALNITELYGILSCASRRFSLLARVLEIGSQHDKIDNIVTALTDGLLFRLNDTSKTTDKIILQLADVLQNYCHIHFNDEADAQLRDAWLEVESVLRELGRKI